MDDDEDIPPSLEEKWEKEDSLVPLQVVCQSCGQKVSSDALLCLYCGESTGVRAGVFSQLKHYVLRTPWGLAGFMLFFLAVVAFFALW